jgi:hypothetical protein
MALLKEVVCEITGESRTKRITTADIMSRSTEPTRKGAA